MNHAGLGRYRLLFPLVALCLSGCGGAMEGSPAQGGARKSARIEARACAGALAPLPDPIVWKVGRPELTPAQRLRQQEVDQHLARNYCEAGWRILATTQSDSGDITDWLDPASVPGSEVQPPPGPLPEEMQPPAGARLQGTEMSPGPEVRGPKSSIPMTRPSFNVYIAGETRATSLEDWIREHQVPSLAPQVDREGPPDK